MPLLDLVFMYMFVDNASSGLNIVILGSYMASIPVKDTLIFAVVLI
mgnify:CR=1 FL=1